jgi:hypothetical protein
LRLNAARALVQQVAEVGGRRFGQGYRQEHRRRTVARRLGRSWGGLRRDSLGRWR